MQERQKIITEYFALIVKLNRSNKLPNMGTVLTFEVVQNDAGIFQLMAKLNGSDISILLSEYSQKTGWEPLYFSGYKSLENFISTSLNSIHLDLNIKHLDSLNHEQGRQIINQLMEELSSLGVPKSAF